MLVANEHRGAGHAGILEDGRITGRPTEHWGVRYTEPAVHVPLRRRRGLCGLRTGGGGFLSETLPSAGNGVILPANENDGRALG